MAVSSHIELISQIDASASGRLAGSGIEPFTHDSGLAHVTGISSTVCAVLELLESLISLCRKQTLHLTILESGNAEGGAHQSLDLGSSDGKSFELIDFISVLNPAWPQSARGGGEGQPSLDTNRELTYRSAHSSSSCRDLQSGGSSSSTSCARTVLSHSGGFAGSDVSTSGPWTVVDGAFPSLAPPLTPVSRPNPSVTQSTRHSRGAACSSLSSSTFSHMSYLHRHNYFAGALPLPLPLSLPVQATSDQIPGVPGIAGGKYEKKNIPNNTPDSSRIDWNEVAQARYREYWSSASHTYSRHYLSLAGSLFPVSPILSLLVRT